MIAGVEPKLAGPRSANPAAAESAASAAAGTHQVRRHRTARCGGGRKPVRSGSPRQRVSGIAATHAALEHLQKWLHSLLWELGQAAERAALTQLPGHAAHLADRAHERVHRPVAAAAEQV